MATKDSLFTVAGITTHRGQTDTGVVSERTKVRYGTDMVRLVKMLNDSKKVKDRALRIGLAPVRVDLVDLPRGMLKMDALKFLAIHPEFQSPEDQALIAEEQAKREPKTPRVKKQKQVKVKGNIDSINGRIKQKLTAEQLLAAAFAEEPTQE